MPVTGFQCQASVNDGASNAFVRFAGLMTINLPALEASTFDATELDQEITEGTPDPYERELPTGLIKVGKMKGELYYTKANYLRLQALLKARGKTYSLTTPDDQTSGNATKLTGNFPGFVSKIEEPKFEKDKPTTIPFEITVQSKPTWS